MSAQARPRMVWFDANRVCAAIGVVLIHCTADFAGGAFPKATAEDRLGPVIGRAIAEFSGSEMFFLFSLFLLAFKLDRRRPGYGAALGDQARRLLVPFAFWLVFYALFRLVKAQEFGYAPAIWAQLGQWQSWAGYALLGNAQYHLHFLPTLFLLVLFFPVMRLGQRYPLFGLLLPVTLGVMQGVQGWIWTLPVEGLAREMLLRGAKVMGYVGYGFAAFAIFGLWKDGLPRGESRLLRRGAIFLAATAFLATLPHFWAALQSGSWGGREGGGFWGHYLMPLAIFAIFLGAQYADWSPRWSRLAKYTFGIYLMHPLVIDLFDVAVHAAGLPLSPTALVAARFAFALPATAALAVLTGRIPALAWTIGLGPLPWAPRAAARPRLAEV
ncbi:acyltransferase [Xinfangfangia pollutisoli]|uniref:acyltransferase n=1 Tax=Xinfangfangia pollutisoli TaxID=2865960 RepID=UPI001CD5757A|nr:acyltransferase [Xinfangfangia pollutisoli]